MRLPSLAAIDAELRRRRSTGGFLVPLGPDESWIEVSTVEEVKALIAQGAVGDSRLRVLVNGKALGDPEDLPALTKLAERLEPALRQAFLRAVQGLQGEIDLEALAQAVQSGHVSQAEALARLDDLATRLDRLLPVIRQGFLEGAKYAYGALGTAAISMRFDLINPHAVQWVESHGGDLITQVSDQSRLAVRDLVAQSVAGGPDVRATARLIRNVVGLTSRQAAAVVNFRERLINEGVAFEDVMRRTERYAEAQLRQRATMIARTETLASENAGQQALWREAKQAGLLTATTKRVWIASMDDRVDPTCEALDGTEAELDGEFPGGYMMPPDPHPGCRCTTGLVFH